MTGPVRDWRHVAACRTYPNPDVFFPDGDGPEHAGQIATAKAVCGSCPVRVACLAHATAKSEPCGVWGGLTASERRHGRPGAPVIDGTADLVAGVGTWRRVRALAAVGWPRRELAVRLGIATPSVVTTYGQSIGAGRHARVTREVAEAVDRLYMILSRIPGPSQPARVLARARGWPPPRAWAGRDIDDLFTTPADLADERQEVA